MKRLLSFFAVLLFAIASWGQFETSPSSSVYAPHQKAKKSAHTRASINPADGQLWWNNYDASEEAAWYLVDTSSKGSYSAATYIPYGLVGGKGTTIDGFSFYPITSSMTNVKVWVSTALPTKDAQADLEIKNAPTNLDGYKFNDVSFDSHHEIPEGGLYVGFSFDMTSTGDQYEKSALLRTSTSQNRNGGFWMISPGDKTWEKPDGNLISRVLFGGGNFHENILSIIDIEPAYAAIGGTADVAIVLNNQGYNVITSFNYTITTGSTVSEEQEASCHIEGFSSGIAILSIPADESMGENVKTITITKVNGIANNSTANTGSCVLSTLGFMPTVVPVMEEFTGTWCGWCTRGIVGLKKVKETYGDKVITIAVHAGDPMEIGQYAFHSSLITGYPGATINRGESIDPYYDINLLDKALKSVAPCEISVSAEWVDDSKNAISISTATTFAVNSSSSQLAIGFVLVEDGMSGYGSGWLQSNYYTGQSENDPYLEPLTQLPSIIDNMEYDHVAVDGWGVHYGLNGSLPESAESGVAQNYIYLADISANQLIQDKSKLHVVALLLDKKTGKIYNSAKSEIGEPGSTGIQEVRQATAAGDAAVYNLNGQRVEKPGKGIYLIDKKKVILK